jgi:cytochrome c
MKIKSIFLAILTLPLAMTLIWLAFVLASFDQQVDEPLIDPALEIRGARISARCVACHSLDRRSNMSGPHLVGLLGRQSGTVKSFQYVKAMRDSNLIWDQENLIRFLMNPSQVVPGTAMVISPMSATDAKALVQYLEQLQ